MRFPVLAALALLAILIVSGGSLPARAADYFGKPETPAGAPAAAPSPSITLPAPLGRALAVVVSWQTRMNAALRSQLRDARDGTSLRPVIVILAFSFLYGVVHAVGPGHGKVVVGGYFLTRRARLLHGMAMSAAAAGVQALSAIFLVGVLAALFDVSTAAILARSADLETASYGAMLILGLWMVWRALRGHHHDHHNRRGPDHPPAPHRQGRRSELSRIMATGAAVGLRPCSGAILVLLFSLANGIVVVGILATLAMSAGVAITVSLVSLGALGMNRSIARLGARFEGVAMAGYRLAALGGALLIALFGAAELYAVWAGFLTPGAG